MGVGINSMAALLGTAAVSASKVGTALEGSNKSSGGSSQNESPISQANDGELSAKMADKARKNTLANINNILNQNNISRQARSRRIGKELKNLQGGNK